VGTAASRTLLYFASRRTPTISCLPLSSAVDPIRRPIGFSFGKYFRAAASLITTTRGVSLVLRAVKPRPARSGISIVSKNAGETIREEMVSRCPLA
jgi:hypothetical protein